MQTNVLSTVITHIQSTYGLDSDETRKFILMLHETLCQSDTILRSQDADQIYHRAHTLHSELNICGYTTLSEIITKIEIQAKKGVIESLLIDEFLLIADALIAEIDGWKPDTAL
jgi:HPt (histidine-containing phosphotransfer) domain-containing protein